jgi:large conductance mechanosensitive channel
MVNTVASDPRTVILEELTMVKEFKAFIMRGSVVDLAVGFIMGAAFTAIVTSFVNDIVMPPVGMILGKVNFANLYINLSGIDYQSFADAKAAGAATINYGVFLNNVIGFLITAFAIFLLVRAVNRLQAKKAPAAPTTKDCPFCYSAINLNATRCPACTSVLSKR